jgi:hypothetical protein
MIASGGQAGPEELATTIRERLVAAGWSEERATVKLLQLADTTYAAQLPDGALYLLESEHASLLARGDTLIDARLQGDEIGVIFGAESGGSMQPAYLLFQRQTDAGSTAGWRVIWAPMGYRDWIATDGEIRFIGDGLERLEVRGSTFGTNLGVGEVFIECRDCPHRWLVGRWEREGDGYVRETALSSDSSLGEVYWEMAERTPYAILYEFLRRGRAGLAATDLAEEAVLDEAQALGLLDDALLLRPETEDTNEVRFVDLEGARAYVARFANDRVIQIESLER